MKPSAEKEALGIREVTKKALNKRCLYHLALNLVSIQRFKLGTVIATVDIVKDFGANLRSKSDLIGAFGLHILRLLRMRNTVIFKLFVLIIAIGMISDSQLHAQKKGKKNKGKKAALDSGQKLELEAMFFEAKRARLRSDNEKAEGLLNDILRFQPENDAALYELSQIKAEQREFDEAIRLATLSTEVASENLFYSHHLYDLYSMSNRYEDAVGVLETIIKAQPGNLDNFYELAYIQKMAGQTKEAIKTLDDIEKKTGTEESLTLEKHRLYMQLNDMDGAVSELEKLIKAYPKESRYYGMLASLHRMTGKNEEARKVYKQLLDVNENDPYAQLYMGQDLYERGEKEKGAELLRKAVTSAQLPIEEKVQILMSVATSSGDEKENQALANDLAKSLADSYPDDPRALMMYGEILESEGKSAEALTYYKKALEKNPSDFGMWTRQFVMYHELGKYQELEDSGKDALEYFPNQPLIYYFRGIALNQLDEFEKANKVLKQGILIGSDDSALLADMHAMVGDNYNSLGKFEKSDSAFDQALELQPNNALVMNNYSYYLSLRNEYLDKAEELSRKSNELSPNNVSFQDTYGWIKYKMGAYKDAADWLKMAMDNGGSTSAVILDHYGDALFQLGKIDEAVENWMKAKELGIDSGVIDQKISERKLIE